MGQPLVATNENRRLVKNFIVNAFKMNNVNKNIQKADDVLEAFSHLVDPDMQNSVKQMQFKEKYTNIPQNLQFDIIRQQPQLPIFGKR